MQSLTPRQFYDTLIANMPHGIERAMLRILSFHVGKDHAIDKPTLMSELKNSGFHTNERQARSTIVDLRKHGHLICSSSGEGGYFIAQSQDEYDEFAQVEYRSKIIDMSETLRAMDEGAVKIFRHAHSEPVKQVSLF
jgi:hypothetical protein